MQLKSKKIGFRLFTFFTLGGCGLDLTYFVYLCKTSGFDAVWLVFFSSPAAPKRNKEKAPTLFLPQRQVFELLGEKLSDRLLRLHLYRGAHSELCGAGALALRHPLGPGQGKPSYCCHNS